MADTLNTKVKYATKWSAITEIIAKLVLPITSMVLARILTPDAFGVVATISMIITFAEIFTDAGFQKYIIQHNFLDDLSFNNSVNVAFWSNLVLSLILWLIIVIFANPLARFVGNPGLGKVISISCISIPLAAFSSIQMAVYRRSFEYKTLFKVRMSGVVIPLVVTIPLAFLLKSYWAIIIGSIAQNIINAVLLTVYSSWKPRLFYDWTILKEMLSFSIWSMIESISIWLTSYVDVFVVGTLLSQHYLGLYKTTISLVGQIMGIITATTTSILFSALSRLQDNEEEFKKLFYDFQLKVSMLLFPIGIILLSFNQPITNLLLGNQWLEASEFIGLWGVTSAITIVFASYCGEVYRAKGKPKVSVLVQWLHLIVLIPVIVVASKYGFRVLYISRSLVRIEAIIVNLVAVYLVAGLSVKCMMKNMIPVMLASFIMILVPCSYSLIQSTSIYMDFIVMIVTCIVYLLMLLLFPRTRSVIYNIIKRRSV